MDAIRVISLLGGPARLARDLGLSGPEEGAVLARAWIWRNSIPSAYFADIARVARNVGCDAITIEALADMAARRRAEGPPRRGQKSAQEAA